MHPAQTILLVDDDEFQLALLDTQLATLGYCDVILARGGDEALAQFERFGPQIGVIISDLSMPDMDGLALAHHIRDEKGAPAKLVMVTGENVHASRYRYALGDFDAIIEKPATFALFGEVLADL